MTAILRVQQLTGGYNPRRPVLHELDFEVKAGEMVGLIGLNGAGKSTTIKHILGLMEPQKGQVSVDGVTLADNPEKYRGAMAYVPESPVLFDELTVEEHLQLTAMAYQIGEGELAERREELLDTYHMASKRKAFAMHLSKGMKQKVMIMNALLASPPLYIIDEPFLGLDPLGIRSLLEQLDTLKKNGAAILMSSHILATVESYCERFVVLHHGKMIAKGTLDDVRHTANLPGASLEEVFYQLVAGDA